jgi:tetratricopeptide (TPR) repeat protein
LTLKSKKHDDSQARAACGFARAAAHRERSTQSPAKPRAVRIALSLSLLLTIVCAGCASKNDMIADRAVERYFSGDYAAAAQELKPLAEKTDQNFVLNNLRLGSASLVNYDLDDAEAAFYRAYEVINSMGVNAGGRSLGAVLVDEKIKVWKGEPFERAMANYYLGLVYYMRHEYDNARGAFENALFKLRDFSGDDDKKGREVESDFAPAEIMLGRSWQRLGREDLAKANFEHVAQTHPQLAALSDYDRNANSNLLLVVDFGYGPKKLTDMDGSIIGFGPTPMEVGPIPPPVVRVDGRPADLSGASVPPVDLLALAQQRKWESIDTIRAVKSVVGTGLLYGGAIEGIRGVNGSGARQRTDLMVSAGLLGAGLLMKATSQADTRQWEMLPRTTFILPLRAEPGTHDVSIDFPNAPGISQTWKNLSVPQTGEATYYFRMQRWNSGPFTWPPPALGQRAGGAGAGDAGRSGADE